MKTVCSAFWKHFSVRSDNNIFPCCRYKTPVAKFDGDLEKVLNSPVFEKLRQDSLNGVYNPNCEKCYSAADPKLSVQHFFNTKYSIDSVNLEFLEIGFDNICNLACDGCSSEFSSTWADLDNPIKERKINIRSTSEITVIPNTITKILFLGGEPLMTNRHRYFLDKVQNKSKVRVIYNTNGTFLLDESTVSLLKEFEHVKFILSLDGYGALNERVRHGSSWQDIIKFIEQIKMLGHELEVHTVVHINNYFGITELGNFVKQINLPQRVNVLTRPANLDVKNLDPTKKSDFIKDLEQSDFSCKTVILNYLRN